MYNIVNKRASVLSVQLISQPFNVNYFCEIEACALSCFQFALLPLLSSLVFFAHLVLTARPTIQSNLPSPPSQSFLNSLHQVTQLSQPDRSPAPQSPGILATHWNAVESAKDWSIGVSDASISRYSRGRRLPLTPPERYPVLLVSDSPFGPNNSGGDNNSKEDAKNGFVDCSATATYSPRINTNTFGNTPEVVSFNMSACSVQLSDRSESAVSGDRI